MKKIVLVNPPLTLEERYGTLSAGGTSLPPLGLTILASVLRQNGIPAAIVDAAVTGITYDMAVKEILKENPCYVGITAVTVSIHNAAKLAKMLKEVRPDVITIIGGPHITALPELTMEMFPEFDLAVQGEGEIPTVELLRTLETQDDLKKVKGILFRQDGTVINTGRGEMIKNLDELPLDAWDLLANFPFAYKSSVHKLGRLPTTSLITSRGCPFNCRFCDNSMFGRRIRGYSTDRLFEIINYLQKTYGIKDIFMNDDNFVLLKKRLYEFCERILIEKIDLTWGCYSRIDTITDLEMLKLMKRAGCWRISFGLESGSQKILDFYRKGETLEQMEKVIKWTHKAGIKIKGFFMMGNFLETEKTLQETIDFAKKLKLDDFHATFLTPLPGSEIYNIVDEYGTFNKDWKKMSMWFPVFVPKNLTQEILIRYRKKALMQFYFRPRIIISYLLSFRHLSDFVKVFKGLKAILNTIFSKSDQTGG